MSRCLATVFATPKDLKRCIQEEHGPSPNGYDGGHLWVEATNAEGTARIVRWYGNSKYPAEILIARKE